MSDTRLDLLVIGAGPGGYVAAIRAAQLGMRVGCADKGTPGGTCLNVGCIPSKALLDSSELFYQAKTSFARHGIQTGGVELDLPAMMERKDQIVQNLTRGVAGLFRKNKIELIQGAARIVSPGVVEVQTANGPQRWEAERILIATGSAPVELPGFPFDRTHIINSTDALSLPEVPKRMAVIGAGAVGLELGSVWSRLGAEVLVVEFMDRIVPGLDPEMTAELQRALEQQGISFELQTRADAMKKRKASVALTLVSDSGKTESEFDKVLVAVGRRPFTDGLGLKEAGVTLDERGRIPVDENFETNIRGIYAIGDVVPGLMLAHKAEEEGVAAAERMAGNAGHVNYDVIPSVVYTHPELACTGQSEADARANGLAVRVGKFPFKFNGRAMCMDATEGLVKIVADEKTDRLLGVHILAARASDLIAEAVMAMEFEGSAEDIARSVHAHPTMAEAIKEAALAVDSRAIHM